MSILIKDIRKTYPDGTQALKGFSLSFPGGTVGLLGPNGSGKTTLMRILATLLSPTSGEAEVFGIPLGDRRRIRSLLGYLPQTFGFHPQMSVWETLRYFAVLKDVPERGRLDDVLDQVGLSSHAATRTSALSGGMRQRLGIAVALLNDPRLLIVDEPTAGLDTEGRIELRNLIATLPGSRTVLISSHIVEDVAQTVSMVAVLFEGRQLFTGPPGELARVAEGQTWEGKTDVAELSQVERTHYVTSSARAGDSLRFRCIGPGLPGLEPSPPTLEDGFLVLLRRGRLQCDEKPA